MALVNGKLCHRVGHYDGNIHCPLTAHRIMFEMDLCVHL